MARQETRRIQRFLDRHRFAERVLSLVDSIPRGALTTYGDVAREAGFPRHARHVGRVLSGLRDGSPLPWHRVLSGTGKIPRRAGGGEERQRARLVREGVSFDRHGRVDLERHRWRPIFS